MMTSGTNRPIHLEPTRQLPAAAAPDRERSTSPARRLRGRALLPLRIFLGITFIYAGVQKITDPHFFRPGPPDYIGNQILSFAHGSPLHDLLIHLVVPHSLFFGWLIALGELAIGLGALVGLLLRPAAFFGLLLSLLFFLTASWHVYPYFYGSDIVFVFCWLTLLLAGPLSSGLPSLDAYLLEALQPPEEQPGQSTGLVDGLLRIVLGGNAGAEPAALSGPASGTPTGRGRTQQQRLSAAQRHRENRRSFVLGVLTGGASALVLAFGGGLLLLRSVVDDRGARSATTSSSRAASTTTGTASASAGTGTIIARKASVASNSAVTFTIPSSGDPGILVHLASDQFVAYDAVCTHAGCQVDYDPGSQLLICPCHGAEFDPAHGAAVVGGPAPDPLTAVTIHIDSAGNILLQ
jgi:thiosulfate dehydrogenase [quinone] large subunit